MVPGNADGQVGRDEGALGARRAKKQRPLLGRWALQNLQRYGRVRTRVHGDYLAN